MTFSKEDLFCEAMACDATEKTTDALDFGAHGDDNILTNLWWLVFVKEASAAVAITVTWETAAKEDFSDAAVLYTKTVANAAKGSYPVANEPLPRGLKQYNRLKINAPEGTTVFAGLLDGRVEPIAK